VAECAETPQQKFKFGFKKDMRTKHGGPCADVSIGGQRAPVNKYDCHGGGGNQMWKYKKVRLKKNRLIGHF